MDLAYIWQVCCHHHVQQIHSASCIFMALIGMLRATSLSLIRVEKHGTKGEWRRNSGTDRNHWLLCYDFSLWMVKEFSQFNHCSCEWKQVPGGGCCQHSFFLWIAEQTYIIEMLHATFDSLHFLRIQLPLSFHCVHLRSDVPLLFYRSMHGVFR